MQNRISSGIRRKGSLTAAAILGGSMLLTGCGSTQAADSQTTASQVVVDMQQAQTGNLTLQNSFVGTISAQETVYVIPFASGTVTEVNYQVGDTVNAGDVLFRIDDDSAQLQLRQAQLSNTSAQQQVAMANGSSQQATDLQLEGSLVSSESSYKNAQLSYYQLKDKYDTVNGQCEDLEDAIEGLQAGIAAGGIVSGGNAVTVSQLQTQLEEAQTNLVTLQTTRDTLKENLRQAEVGYEAAEKGLDITEKSKALTQGAVRQDTKAQSNTSLEMAQLGVDSAELALSYYTVTAPISGVIQSRSVEVNGIAASSSPAFTIANENSMTVTFQVSEAVKNTFQVGDTITVERTGGEYVGHITEIGVAVNQQTGLFQIKANVEADGSILPSGVSVKITADTYEADNAILIPYDAVYYDTDGSYVYLCVDGKAVKKYVTTGIFDDTTIAVTEGINAGDTVITSWSPRLLDGVEVAAPDAVQK